MNYNILKDLLQTSDDYGSIFDFFFQNFAEESSFYEKGNPSMNPTLPKVIKAMGENFYGKNCRINGYRMTEIEEESFIHGTCSIEDCLTLVVYFSDINIGLASISMGGSMFKFVRLSASEFSIEAGIPSLELEEKIDLLN